MNLCQSVPNLIVIPTKMSHSREMREKKSLTSNFDDKMLNFEEHQTQSFNPQQLPPNLNFTHV